MKEIITKILMIGLILLFAAGILSLSAAIFVAGFIAVAILGAYISIRRWWLRRKGVPVREAQWTSFSESFTPPHNEQEERQESVTIIEVEYEEVKEKDKP